MTGAFENGVGYVVDVEHRKVGVVTLEIGLFDCSAETGAIKPGVETVGKLVGAIDVDGRM